MRLAASLLAVILLTSAAHADLRVIDSADVVYLHDGTEVRGTVIAVGFKAVVIIVDEKEVIIPRERVKKITRGEVGRDVKGYATEVVEGLKRITGVGESAPDITVDAGPAPAGGPAPKGKGLGITKERLTQLMKTNPMLARIVKAQGGPDKALIWLEKNQSNPEVKRYLDSFLKSGQLPKGLPGARPPGRKRPPR